MISLVKNTAARNVKPSLADAQKKRHSVRSNAVRAARQFLGSEAVKDDHFSIMAHDDGTFSWRDLRSARSIPAVVSTTLPTVEGEDVVPAFLKKGRKTAAVSAVAPVAPKAPEKPAKGGLREGTKGAKVLEMIRRPGGATSAELQKEMGWAPHTLRGFLSTTNRKEKLGLKTERKDGVTRYTID